MTTKLTLSIEKELIEYMKIYAKSRQRSLSELVQKYFEHVKEDKEVLQQFPPNLQQYIGIAKIPKNYTDEDLENDKREYLENKHL